MLTESNTEVVNEPGAAPVAAPSAKGSKKKASTAHFKEVPQERSERDRIRAAAAALGQTLDKSKPLQRADLQEHGEQLLKNLGLEEKYLGFAMVLISNEFWREQVMAIDFKRRLFLLPHCLKHAEGCPADYDEFGLDCRKCGACGIADFKVKAEDLGYKVLVSEGTPIVLKIIVSGHVDAIVGVACLNVLEKALDKVLLAGVPAVAVPLLSSNCRNTSVDEDWVAELIDLRTAPPAVKTKTYVHLMRAANRMFETEELDRLAPRTRAPQAMNDTRPDYVDPLALHESIAYNWLRQGGKRARPFITLAAYDALRGAAGTFSEEAARFEDHVCRAALAIETFHKASLVHDDIEDDDIFRYGQETIHRQHGVPVAINVGDYLIGLGYRLVSRDRKALGGDCAADILDKLAEAHLKLSEGQGAELLWRQAADKALTPLDALKIYALKTSPAFEAALYAGLRLAGPADNYEKAVTEFSRHLGIAFQILNDLKDWEGDEDNKLKAGTDVLAARPTLLLALALEGSQPEDRAELLRILACHNEEAIPRVRELFERARVFEKAEKLIDKSRARAEAVADNLEPTELRELLYYLVDTVLERQPPVPEPEPVALLQLSV
ncbi:MAG: polyprenyl synthetase family protein [Gemmataceae bacterium]